jgi:lipopolysaccharide transport system ATP-binding protein
LSGSGYVELEIPELHLGMGEYYVSVGLSKWQVPLDKSSILYYRDRTASFAVRRQHLHPYAYVYEPLVRKVHEHHDALRASQAGAL